MAKEEAREIFGVHVCDRRRPTKELAETYEVHRQNSAMCSRPATFSSP